MGTNRSATGVSQPGTGSLPCLSCHDGQQAVDAIINMPGSGRYDPSGAPSTVFPGSWPNASGSHDGLSSTGCLACHGPTPPPFANTAANFTVAAIGTDLRNDHPVGVNFPTATGAGTDWKTPSGGGGPGHGGNQVFR